MAATASMASMASDWPAAAAQQPPPASASSSNYLDLDALEVDRVAEHHHRQQLLRQYRDPRDYYERYASSSSGGHSSYDHGSDGPTSSSAYGNNTSSSLPRSRTRSAFGSSIPTSSSANWDDQPLPSAYAQASAYRTTSTAAAAAATGGNGYATAVNNGYGYAAPSSSNGHGDSAYYYSYSPSSTPLDSSPTRTSRPITPLSAAATPRAIPHSYSTPNTSALLAREDSGDSGESYGSARSRQDSRDYSHTGRPETPRSRIPTRPRAYSASAASADYHYQETLADYPPPVPPLPSGPSQSFPQPPPSPSQSSLAMSVSSRAPDPPHRLATAGGAGAAGAASSGIPVLKTRGRSTARAPSPDLPRGEMLADEKPPFRVDLDAALAEIEDELEVRAIQRFAQARPSANNPGANRQPRKMPARAATTPSPSRSGPLATSTSSSGSGSTPSAGPSTPSALPISQRGVRAKSRSNASKSISHRNNSISGLPRTPNSTLGRAATLDRGPPSAVDTPPTTAPSTLNGRKRHGSDSTHNTTPAVRQRKQSTTTTPRAARAVNGRANLSASASPASGIPTLSASLNSRGTTPHLGVAAHFVPPENDFAPPKGADWDDVVLPTVAKKLGIQVVTAGAQGSDEEAHSGDDDLAIEWDKDGTPIRWEKRAQRSTPGGLSSADFAANSRRNDFGPGTAPYPDDDEDWNAANQQPSPTRAPLGTGLEPAPLRTSTAQPTSWAEQPANTTTTAPVPIRPAQQNAALFVPQGPPRAAPLPPAANHPRPAAQDSFAPSPMFQSPALAPGSKGGKAKRADHDDEVKGGCGCLIM